MLFFRYIFGSKWSKSLNFSLHGDAIKKSTVLRYCGLRLNCHVTYMTVVCSSECMSSNLVSLSLYKCFFEPFSPVEAPSLASLSWNVG